MDIDKLKEGDKALLLGNEAIALGAIEAGVAVATTYPGTPSSEIGNTLFRVARNVGMYFEFSVNEKVAVEVAAAASASGLRAFTFMKHVGLNVASDAFMTLAYVGVRGGFVLVSADDPSCHSSQNEQDNRYYAVLANVPMLEPATPQEAKDMLIYAYDLSEDLELPVILRTTTRVSHVRGVVIAGKRREIKRTGHFEKNPERFVTVPANARRRHIALLEHMKKAMEISERCPFTHVIGDGDLGIICSGASYNYVIDVVKEYNIDCSVLRIGMTHPVPESTVREFISGREKVIIVEELEPYLEKEVYYIAKKYGCDVEILGKISGHFPRNFEYDNDVVADGILKILGRTRESRGLQSKFNAPLRPPVLCPGCPHRASYYAVKKALRGKDVIFSTDIGCYTLGIQHPLRTADYLLCMGSSIGTGCGFSKATEQVVVSFIGDSTFFHAGIPGMINAIYNKAHLIYIILDNRTTAMTGHQPHPGTGITGMGEGTRQIMPEDIAKAVGVEYVRVVNPMKIDDMVQAVKEASEHKGVSVIVARAPCALLEARAKREQRNKYYIDQDLCKRCLVCVNQFACPAIYIDNGQVMIDSVLCVGCGVCAQVCPFNAIKEKKSGAILEGKG